MEGKFFIADVCGMDQTAWKLMHSGHLTVKMTYALLNDESFATPNLIWKMI